MREGWESKNLQECIERIKYPNKVPRKSFLTSGPFPIISQEKDFINGYWSDDADVLRIKKPVVIFGDHTQVLKYIDFDFVLGADGVKILQPKDFIDPKYFFYFLNAHPLKELGYARHYRILKELNVYYPKSLPEQQRIVAILDEAFEGIGRAAANAEKNLANARELFESNLNAIFIQKGEGCVEKRLSKLMEIKHGFAFKGPDFKTSTDVDKPIVLTPGNYAESGELYFTEKNTKRFTGAIPQDYLFSIGDLTIVMTDLSSKMKILGKPAFIDRPNILHNQRIGRVIFRSSDLDPKYVYYFLRTRKVIEKIKETSTGTMVRHTAPKRILAATIPVPPTLLDQRQIVSDLDGLAIETTRLEVV